MCIIPGYRTCTIAIILHSLRYVMASVANPKPIFWDMPSFFFVDFKHSWRILLASPFSVISEQLFSQCYRACNQKNLKSIAFPIVCKKWHNSAKSDCLASTKNMTGFRNLEQLSMVPSKNDQYLHKEQR